jgi:hypothetical protein
MELLQPYMLWGTLAVTLPVIIHFWYQKKGKTIAWAASRWLTEKTTLQHRGVRLDEIPLLSLRCLLIILLALILSKPLFNWLKDSQAKTTIHLVQPNRAVADNFRFEIESAKKKGEAVYWINPEVTEFTDLASIPDIVNSELFLQNTLDQLAGAESKFNIYVANNHRWADLPNVNIPGAFKVFITIDSSKSHLLPYMEIGEGRKLFVDPGSGELAATEANANLAGKPVHSGAINVLVQYKNDAEGQTALAGILALKQVYHIPFVVDLKPVENKHYEWVLTDQNVERSDSKTLYIISGKIMKMADPENLISIQDSLRLQSSNLVESGELPEWLGNVFVSWFKIKENRLPLSNQQMHSVFVKTKPAHAGASDQSRQWLLLFFLLTIIAERWIALGKTTGRSYA